MKNYNINTTELEINFACVNCGNDIQQNIDELPMPNYEAYTVADSENTDEFTFICENCEHEYVANVYANMNEGNIEIFDSVNDEEIDDFELNEITE